MEKTFAIIKPDGIKKKLIGEIIRRIESENLMMANLKVAKLTKKQVSEL